MSELTYNQIHALGTLRLGYVKEYSDLELIGHVVKEWEPSKEAAKQLSEASILVAYEDYEDYSGAAVYLFWHYHKLFYVEGSHCSCMGFEDQWEPEETSLDALAEKHFYFLEDESRDKVKAYIRAALSAATGVPSND